ncbi:MAG: hypothetical protein AB1349_01230 [Elusimicrobiota bacterium]
MKQYLFLIAYFLSLISYTYCSVIYINTEEDIKNFSIALSTTAKNIFVIPSDLLKNLSDENKLTIKKMKTDNLAEFAGTTYTEVLLPLLYKAQLVADVQQQINKGRQVYSEVFDEEPVVFCPYMGIVAQEVLELVNQTGYTVFISSSGEPVELKNIPVLSAPDLSRWLDAPIQKLAWNYIQQTRTKLDEYADSESYTTEKYDAVLEELYLLEKPIWYENYVSVDTDRKKENDMWFRAGLSNIYRVVGLQPPSEISVPFFGLVADFSGTNIPAGNHGDYLVYFEDSEILSSSSSICNITAFGVQKSSDILIFDIFVSSQETETIDVYIDMNKKNNVGSTAFLAGHSGFTDSVSAWEYAISVSTIAAELFRYNRNDLPTRLRVFGVELTGGVGGGGGVESKKVRIGIPQNYIRGNPKNWGYVVCGFLPSGEVFDAVGYNVSSPETVIQIPALRTK